MRLKILILAVALFWSGSTWAQSPSGGYGPGTGSSSSSSPSSPTLPGTCTAGASIFLTVNAPPNFIGYYDCSAAGVYIARGQGGVDPAFVGAALSAVGGQTQIIQAVQGSTSGPTSPFTLAFPSLVSQGRTILALVAWQNTGPTLSSITDTQTDSFVQVGVTRTTSAISGSAFNVAVFKALSVTGGAANTVSATFSAGATQPRLIILELTPGDVDVSASATGNGTALSSGNVTTTNAQDSLFGLGFVNIAATGTAGSGYSFISGFNAGLAQFGESQVVNATGTYSATMTAGSTTDWAIFVVAMKGTPVTPVLSNSVGAGPFSLGTITTPLTPVQFKISGGQITAGAGQLNINVTSGSITSGIFALTASIDGGTTWFAVPCQLRTITGIIGSDQTPVYSGQCSLVGLMGESGTNFRFGPVAGFGISNLVVWGSI